MRTAKLKRAIDSGRPGGLARTLSKSYKQSGYAPGAHAPSDAAEQAEHAEHVDASDADGRAAAAERAAMDLAMENAQLSKEIAVAQREKAEALRKQHEAAMAATYQAELSRYREAKVGFGYAFNEGDGRESTEPPPSAGGGSPYGRRRAAAVGAASGGLLAVEGGRWSGGDLTNPEVEVLTPTAAGGGVAGARAAGRRTGGSHTAQKYVSFDTGENTMWLP